MKQTFTKIRGQIKAGVDALVSFVYILVHPGYWLQNESYSAIWDAQLKKLLAKHTFKDYDGYHASLGGLRIWVSNHPYASFTFKHVRPKRTTILKAHRQLMRDIIIEATSEDEVQMLNRMYERS